MPPAMPAGSGPALADDAEVLGVDDRRARRRLPPGVGRAIAVVAAAALVVGLGPRLLSAGGGAGPAAGTRGSGASSRSPAAGLPPDLRWPTRGDLAGDARLLSQSRARLTGSALTDVAQVLWAGHVSGGRAVVVAGHDRTNGMDPAYDLPVVALLLPGGAEPQAGGRVVPVTDLSGGANGLVAWAVPGGRQVLLLGRPVTLHAEVSTLLTIDAGGVPHRSWFPVTLARGAALVELPQTSHPALAVRLAGGAGVAVLDEVERHVATLPVPGLHDGSYRGPDAQAVDAVVNGELGADPLYGWPVRGTLLWSGRVGTHAAHIAVVRLVRSDGATFELGVIGSPGSGVADLGLRPVPTDRAARPYVLASDETGEFGWPAQVALLDPTGPADVEVLPAAGPAATYRGAPDGLVLLPDGLTRDAVRSVTVVDGEGRLDVTTAVTAIGAPTYGSGFALVD